MAKTLTQDLDKFRIDKLDLSHIITEDDTPVDNLFSDRWLAEMGAGAALWEGQYENMADAWSRWCDLKGDLLATGQEALAEKSRQLGIESQGAEQEKQRAEQAEQRVAALAKKLAALGIDPTID
jgi:hypothetical protein